MTMPTLRPQPPRPDAWRRSTARAPRLLCVALLALPFSGCCARPDQPRPPPAAFHSTFEERQLAEEWRQYDDCIDDANILIFGVLASAHGQGYREEVRGPATSPPPSPQITLPDTPLPR